MIHRSGIKKLKPELSRDQKGCPSQAVEAAGSWRRWNMARQVVHPLLTQKQQFAGSVLELSQLTQTGIKSKYESSSLDDLSQ